MSDSAGIGASGRDGDCNFAKHARCAGTVTSENGDYILSLLPSGTYRVVFELSGFQRQERRTVGLAPTQVMPLQVELGVAALTETVQVVGQAADVLVPGQSQVATNFDQTLMSTLPTQQRLGGGDCSSRRRPSRLVPAAASRWPARCGPENLYMVNGVSLNENLRGQAQDLVYRRRAAGNDGCDGRSLGRVRPLWRRRRTSLTKFGLGIGEASTARSRSKP